MHKSFGQSQRRKALALQIVATLAVCASMPIKAVTTWTVSTCADDLSGLAHSGSLRYAIANASDNDVIDLTGLTCSTISLQTGALLITQPHLHLQGPGKDKLTISGALEHDRVLLQRPPSRPYEGEVYLSDLSVQGGDYRAYAAVGGCIYSYTRLGLSNVNVSNCHVSGPTIVSGGAIFAKQSVSMSSSSVTKSDVTAYGNAFYNGLATGGGIQARGLSVTTSTISGNSAKCTHSQGSAVGGGIYIVGGNNNETRLIGSTVSENSAVGTNGANAIGGGLIVSYGVVRTSITNSTISDNYSSNIVGGMFAASSSIEIGNSTISNNSAHATSPAGGTPIWSAGFTANSGFGAIAITLDSTIIANNQQGGDVPYLSDFAAVVSNNNAVSITGSNNLVQVVLPASVNVPGDTLTGICPLLGPLRDNGGSTKTRALMSLSPAIDKGNNAANLAYDQRLSTRVSGRSADIGAYEFNYADEILSSGFDGCL